MNCREFEVNWNLLLDSGPEGASQLERAMEAHASTCQRCRAVSTRYQVLRQAISAWATPPTPSAGSIERLYELAVPARSPTIPFRRPLAYRLIRLASAAAASFALAWAGWSTWHGHRSPEQVAMVSNSASAPATQAGSASRPLGSALAEATEATIDLAREASAPAARIGREILELGRLPDLDPAGGPAIAADVDDSSASDLLSGVGQRVSASVKPFRGSARHAFSFLLGPPSGPDPAPASPQDSL